MLHRPQLSFILKVDQLGSIFFDIIPRYFVFFNHDYLVLKIIHIFLLFHIKPKWEVETKKILKQSLMC